MALVAVVNLLLDAQLVQHQDTTDTQQILLLHTVLPIATIELVCDGAIPLAVLRNIRIHQIQRYTAYANLPDIGVNDTTGIGNLQHHRLAV